MCGILGSFSGLRVLPPRAVCRSDLLRHRGPDSVGWYGYGKFAAACDWVQNSAPWPHRGSPLERYLASSEFVFPEPA